MVEAITEHLDIWTNAQIQKGNGGRGRGKNGNGQSIYGIKKLRELILELAVRGKLVPQDSDDEPASILLRKIAEEKTQLVKDGTIKKQKELPAIDEKSVPFSTPSEWKWCWLGELGLLGSSSRVHKKNWTNKGVPFLRAREIVALSKSGEWQNELFISEDHFEALSKKGLIPEAGDIMITGVGTIGVPYEVKDNEKFYFKDASVLIFKNYFCQLPEYLCMLFQSPYWNETIHKGSMGTTVHTLTISRANKILIPLPPLAEQKRIVTKVDELMALCDKLEEQQLDHNTTHQTLVENLLSTLTNATDQVEFEDTWQRITTHFDTLFTTLESIDYLKQTTLQLAVMGKLVSQDPDDEPASVLLEKIAEEKTRLVKEGMIKKQKKLPKVNETNTPFSLPKGWAWARFPELGEFGRGKSKHRPRNDPSLYVEGKIPMIQTGDVARSNGNIRTFSAHYNEKGLSQSKLWPSGTVCITIAANIADSGILSFDACFPDSVVGLTPSSLFDDAKYFEYFMRTAKERLLEFAPSTAQKNINLSILEKVLIPLPPKNELTRIVAKVDELMILCDSLKEKLTTAQTTQLQLADTIVSQAAA